MSRSGLRYGGAALAGTFALGLLINQSAVATTGMATPLEQSVIDQALASLPDLQDAQSQVPQAITAGVAVPALTHLAIPNIGAAATSQGYALRDVLIDAAPDLADRDLTFVLQRQQQGAWVEAAKGTTGGADDVATVPDMPAGTYRVVVPAQFGMARFAGESFAHQPRQLTASLAFDASNVRTNVDISPDPAGAYQFVLQRKNGGAWQNVSSHATSTRGGGFAFTDIPSGTYRIAVPDQANAIGTASNEITAISRADQERQAAEAAARRAAATAAAAPASSGSSGSASSSNSSRPASSSGSSGYTDAAPVANAGGIVGTALAQVGDRYVRGGNGPDAFDCSGLTSYAYRAAGISIPRTAAAQWAASTRVSSPRPGDLVFFNGAGHVGVYLGNGKMVHAANPSRPVEVVSTSAGWYGRTFMGFGRF